MQTPVVPGASASYVVAAMRLAFLPLSLSAALTLRAQAPWPAPTLKIIDSVRFESRKEGVNGVPTMALRADGSLAVVGAGAQLAYFDSTARRKWIRHLYPDVRWIAGINWNGDSIHVFDNATDQVLAIGANGGVGDLFDFPDFVRPQWKDRRTMPAYGALDVVAIVDSSLIGTPRRPHTLGMYGTSVKPDPTRKPVLRVNHDGILQANLGTIVDRSDVWSILPDGRMIVFRQAKDSLSLIGISPRGDTLFARRLPKVRVVFGATGGPTDTFWVSYSLGGTDFHHTLFDAKGIALGRVTLPSSVRIGAGDARHLWVYDARPQTKPIIRYTLRP